jgi:hypothetical protein
MVGRGPRPAHLPAGGLNGFARIILPHIGAGDNEMLVCGMSLAPTWKRR